MDAEEFNYYLWNPLEYKRDLLNRMTRSLEEKYGKKAKRFNSVQEFTEAMKRCPTNGIIVIDEVSQ